MLTHVEEPNLMERYQTTHDPLLREELVLQYVPMVHYVLGRLGISRELGPDYEDLVSQGLIGLIEAVDRFNPELGAHFNTYAVVKIRGKILDYLRSLDWLSRTARHRSRVVQLALTNFVKENQRPPTDDEIAKKVGLDVEQVQKALTDSNVTIVSLDRVLEVDLDGETTLHDLLPDGNDHDPSDVFDEGEMKLRLATAIKQLNEREQLVLSLYYFEELTFKEIGVVLGVTESRICQLHARAVITLKAYLAA